MFPCSVRSGTLVLLLGCGLLFLPSDTLAQRVAAPVDSTESVIRYTGSATMHHWTGVSRKASGTIVLDPETPDSSRVLIEAPVASFNSGKDRRDRKMREVTEADRFPTVSYEVTDIRPQQWGRSSDGHAGRWRVTGALTFHGQTHSVDATVDVRITDDSIRAHAQFPISLTRFDVERPKLMWVAPIADTIRIDARVVGVIESSTAGAPSLTKERSEITGTRRVSSSDLREASLLEYAGRSAGLRAEVRLPPDGDPEWILAFYGFGKEPTGMATAQNVSLRSNRRVIEPVHVVGTSRTLDDGTIVEISRLHLSKNAFETIASALTLEADIGPARFSTDWRSRQDMRQILQSITADSPGPVTVDEY